MTEVGKVAYLPGTNFKIGVVAEVLEGKFRGYRIEGFEPPYLLFARCEGVELREEYRSYE